MTAIAFGFMAVCTFRGYMHDAYNKIALGAIFVENPGHLTVFKRGFLKEGRLYPEKYLFTGAEAAAVLGRVSASPEFVWAAERARWLAGQVAEHFAEGADLALPQLRFDQSRGIAGKVDRSRATSVVGK